MPRYIRNTLILAKVEVTPGTELPPEPGAPPGMTPNGGKFIGPPQ